jgi:hypothetical protein
LFRAIEKRLEKARSAVKENYYTKNVNEGTTEVVDRAYVHNSRDEIPLMFYAILTPSLFERIPETNKERNSPSPVLSQLLSILMKQGWPICLCKFKCICDTATLPSWISSFGSIHSELRCLDMSDENFLFSDEFCYGIRRIRNFVPGQDPAIELIVNIALSDTLNSIVGSTALAFENRIANKVGMDGLDLRYFASGCACGQAIRDMFIRWNYLRFHCRTDFSKEEELKNWVTELEKVLKKINLVRQWLRIPFSRNRLQLQFEIWNGVMFWILQHTLFLIEDIRLLSTLSFEHSFKRFDSGLLNWQLGWMQTDKKICAEISGIMFSNNDYIIT